MSETSHAPPVCALCGDLAAPWLRKGGYALFRCTSCGNGFLPQNSIPDDLENLYSREYFEGNRDTGYPSYLREAPMLERNFMGRLEWIERFCQVGTILDVGAAYGVFLGAAQKRGWQATGVEIAPDCAREAERLSGARVLAGDFLQADLPDLFDVVTFFDVIEHMRDPLACLRRARKLLNPGGWVVIETGDPASRWARLLGRRWYFLDPPQHLFYFTLTGLEQALRRCGFTGDTKNCRSGRRVSFANIAFKAGSLLPPGLQWAARTLGRIPGSVPLRLGDAYLLAARRS